MSAREIRREAVSPKSLGRIWLLAIFGGGAVGLSALLGARAVGAGHVFLVEPNARRRELAMELGATMAIDPLVESDVPKAIRTANHGKGVNHAIDTSAVPAAISQAVNSVMPGGVVALVGVPSPEAAIPATLLDLLTKSVTLQPVVEGDANPQTFISELLTHYRAGRFPFDRMITKFQFSQINDAMKAAESGSAIKPVLVI